MQQNILKASGVSKIYFNYVDGKNVRRKEIVKVRYMDNKSCYFVGDIPVNFAKPKWRAKADIVVYTPDGTYSTTVIIRDASLSLREILYRVDIPRTWKYTQMRAGTRKEVKLPVKLKFNDGLEIEAETQDVSIGGFSIITNQEFSTMHTRFACNCKVQFPKDSIINFPDGLLDTSCIYVRQRPILDDYELQDHKVVCFRFVNLPTDYSMILKNYLMKID